MHPKEWKGFLQKLGGPVGGLDGVVHLPQPAGKRIRLFLVLGHRYGAQNPDLRTGGPAGQTAGGGQEIMIGLQPQLQTVPAGQQLGQRAGFGPGFAVGAVDPGNQSFQLGDAVLIFLHQGGRVLGGLFPFLDGCVVAQTAGKLVDPFLQVGTKLQCFRKFHGKVLHPFFPV